MKALLLGMGEVGKGIFDLCGAHTVYSHDPAKGFLACRYAEQYPKVDVLLVAFPWGEGFIEEVNRWREQVEPDAVIIFSTVPIGTSRQIKDAVHFPIEALHPNIMRDLLINERLYMGGVNTVAQIFLQMVGLRFRVLPEPEHTEFLKLRSTAIYGINIEFARYSKTVADTLEMDYLIIQEYDENHNRLNRRRGTPQYQRYILYPPEGQIGGHCVVPNAAILNRQFPFSMLGEILTDRQGERNQVLERLKKEVDSL